MKAATKKLPAKLSATSARNAGRAQNNKDFDAVKTMRAIRDKLSREIMDMTFEEENAYLQKLLAKKTA